jgi:hypothetical protein
MFFLLRMAFWLSLAFLLLPSGVKQAVTGAKAAHDVPRATARDHRSVATARPANLVRRSQDTLTAGDLTPAWRGPRGDIRKKNGA